MNDGYVKTSVEGVIQKEGILLVKWKLVEDNIVLHTANTLDELIKIIIDSSKHKTFFYSIN